MRNVRRALLLRRPVTQALGFTAAALLGAVACSSELDPDGPANPNGGITPFERPGTNVNEPGTNESPAQNEDPGNEANTGNPERPGVEGILGDNGVENTQNDRERGIGGATEDEGPLVDQDGNPLPVDQLPALRDCSTPGPRLIRRLTSEQYRNTLVAAFDNRDDLPDSSPLTDADTLGYKVDADDNLIQGQDAQSLMNLGDDVAEWAQQNGVIGAIANGCTQNNDNCRRQFVQRLGESLSREPLDDSRVNSLVGLFSASVTEDGETIPLAESFEDGAKMVISALVQSPYTLYRHELGEQQGAEFQLTGFEVASELSYFLTNRPPDDALMQAAANNQLSSPDQIEAQAERLLATPEAADVMGRFVTEWLDVDGLFGKVKDAPDGTQLSDSLRAAMIRETEELFLDVLDGGGTIGDLFSANYTYLNQELASFYGLQVEGDGFQRVDLAGSNRAPGLLGHGSYLAEHALADNSSPVQRAFVVRERLLCNELPEVPADLDTNLAPPDPNGTSRQRYTEHSSNQVCYACHQLMDPIGFTFENYDAFGRFRATEANQEVDSSGALLLMQGSEPILPRTEIPLTGVPDLANHLSQSEAARACLANTLGYYAYGVTNQNKWSSETKVCNDHAVRQVARDSGNTLRSVLTGILRAPHFTRRVQDL